MLYNIRASFTGILGVGFNTILIIILFAKPLSVANFIIFY